METESRGMVVFNNVYFPPNYTYKLKEVYDGIKPLSKSEQKQYEDFKKREAYHSKDRAEFTWCHLVSGKERFSKFICKYIKGEIIPLSTVNRKKLFSDKRYILTEKGFVLKEESGYDGTKFVVC